MINDSQDRHRRRVQERLFVGALAMTTLFYVVVVIFGWLEDVQSETVSATAGLCLVLLASFGFAADDDPDFGVLPKLAKALAAGVALPVAVISSGAKLTAISWLIVILAFVVVAAVSLYVKVKAREPDPPSKG